MVFDIPLSPTNWLEERQEKTMRIANFEEEYPLCSRAWLWLVRHCCAAHRVRGIVIDTVVRMRGCAVWKAHGHREDRGLDAPGGDGGFRPALTRPCYNRPL